MSSLLRNLDDYSICVSVVNNYDIPQISIALSNNWPKLLVLGPVGRNIRYIILLVKYLLLSLRVYFNIIFNNFYHF